MTVIVTGGAGFIGSNFIYYLLKHHPEDRVVCVDCLTYAGNLSTLKAAMENPNFRFCKINICDREAVYKLFEEERPDVVVNFAAESHVDRSIENPEVFLQTNILGTAVMMDACRNTASSAITRCPPTRSTAICRWTGPTCSSPRRPPSTQQPLLLLQGGGRPAGAGLSPDLRPARDHLPLLQQLRALSLPEKLIPLMIANALADKPLPVYGEGLNVRDWLYVEDHCQAIDLIVRKGRVGEVYNVGGHNEMRNIDIVKLICKELGKPESLITHVTDRKGHDMRYAIDPTKIHNELGWLPETKFGDGIKKTIQWYLDNRDWWEEIISGEYQGYYERMYGNR